MIRIWKEKAGTDETRNSFSKTLLSKITYFTFGFLSTQGVIFGSCNPFGISTVASVAKEDMFPTLSGAIIGYLFLDRLSRSIGYISIILMMISLKWTLNGLTKIKNHSMFMPILSFVSSLTIGLVTNYSGEFEAQYVCITLMESLIISFCSYCFRKTLETKSNIGSINGIYDLRYMILSALIIVSSMYNFTVYGLSIGKILSILIILLASYCSGVYGGSISGAVMSIVLGISSSGMFRVSGLYALAGTIAGLCSKGGKISICLSFLICSTIPLFYSYYTANIMAIMVYEVIFAVFLFMIIPKEIIYYIKTIFRFNINTVEDCCKNYNDNQYNEKKYISEAIKSISGVTKSVMPDTFPNSRVHIETTCINSVYKVCKNCNLRNLCWEKDSNLTRDFFNRLILDILNNNPDTNYECITGKRCKNINKILDIIKTNIGNYNSEIEAKNRINELHKGVSEKFLFANALYGYAFEEVKFNNVEDSEKSKMIKALLSKFGIETVRTEFRLNDQRKIFIEIEVMKVKNENLINKKILDKLSKLCEVNLDKPVVFEIENRTLIRITEKTIFNLDIFVCNHNCNNGEFCGDCCSYFKDGTGKFSVMISDGMGTGGRAAADSAVTAGIIERLMRLRVAPDSAIKIANLSILGKTSEESLTAVDIMTFDMFSGKAKFIKAGAPITFIYKRGHVEKIETSSLPIGILNETNLSINNIDLEEGDLILMLSDGVTDVGIEWVENKLKNLKNINTKEISESILNEALRRRNAGYDDDITVATMIVVRR